mmetsp:Transcript_10794/g.22859  ORF Transcript_10794/g.22859 Transcript_10794/m.22859 type:complete len:330 (+) Transcript_10794:101-1090(+)|eukprot:CAMPEP_0201120850 /NCGR_PEP_ID=MMETSP0850-20130426/4847_1 /ASSEMBLY_ACC=CAM_ASM_000622 /TAXON_ID=183588 /ORGANISM="Pseudo-nitzschia fraudulenta, Strain WWA7" /LENGTH=329 /DNA_ID=CAMNT_0047387127 /DNA_START=72 /DNA_END=1061 /DNA_ORIENTATION=-
MLPSPHCFCYGLLLPVAAVSAFRSPGDLSSLLVRPGAASVSPIPGPRTNTALRLADFSASSPFFHDFLLVSDSTPNPSAVAAAAATAGVPNPSSLFNFNAGEVAQNIALGFTALVFLLAGVTYIAAAVLVPAGAQQLEIECTTFIPDTWEEYLGKLEEGQAMKDRPDLMFELGLLLNKSKADLLEKVCVGSQLAPDLWEKYQGMLVDDQELQDRPEFIAALNDEVRKRAAQVLRENTNVCPRDAWESFERKARESEGFGELEDRPELLDELALELGYPGLLGAVAACTLDNSSAGAPVVEGDARGDATTISGIAEIRRKDTNQWDGDDE